MSDFKPYHLPHFHIRFQFQNINSNIAVVQSLSQGPTYWDPMAHDLQHSRPPCPSLCPEELAQIHVHWVSDAIQ